MTSNKTILIVEDDPRYRTALTDKLTHEGFTVIAAENGKKGINLALTNKPDLILLDLLMPQMSGLSFMNQIRSDSWGASVPIIILTNLDADDQIVENVTVNNPAYYFVKTNFPLSDLVTKIKEVLQLT